MTPVWSVKTAYAAGLMATDGNLSSDGRHMSFVSRDRELVETFAECLQLATTVRTLRTRAGGTLYRVQWADRRIYDWFISMGLLPAKSLRLGRLAVPDECFADFVRGCIDGDGSVHVYTDTYHQRKKDRYVYERLYVSLVSASYPFLEWIQTTVQTAGGDHGSHSRVPATRATIDLGSPLRQGGFHQTDPLDALRRDCALPRPQARQGREVSHNARLSGGGVRRATEGRMAVQYRRAGFGTAGVSGPGWRNGRLAALKTPCPQGRAGSNPAPGTNFTTPFLTRPAGGR
jgi:hypothetical protein